MHTRFAIIPLDGLAEQIADTITAQLASRGNTICDAESYNPRDCDTAKEVKVIARNVAVPLTMCEVDFDDATERLVDILTSDMHNDVEQVARRLLESVFTITR
jgi:hypothetical protein